MVRRLVNAGAKVTVRDTQGNTALHLACLHGEVECAKEILANESMDLQQWNYNGESNEKTRQFEIYSMISSNNSFFI